MGRACRAFLNVRTQSANISAACLGSGEAMISLTTAMPSSAWWPGDTTPDKTRNAFKDLIPPVISGVSAERLPNTKRHANRNRFDVCPLEDLDNLRGLAWTKRQLAGSFLRRGFIDRP
jgi:hypothetical protein